MIELKCPNCRADIELDDSREVGFCRYCETQILIEPNKSKVAGIAGVENLLLRAEQFLKENNKEKAIEYFNKVLDIDINNEKANNELNRLKTPVSLKDKLSQRKTVAVPIEKRTEIECSASIMLQGIRKYLDNLSANIVSKGCVEGFYCIGGYETDPSIRDDFGNLFFIMDDFGRQKEDILKHNVRRFANGDGTLEIVSREEMTWLITKLESELKEYGFDNPIVKLENVGRRSICCGKKKKLLAAYPERVFTEMPAYRIYFRISW